MQSVVRNLNDTFEATPGSVGEARNRLAEFAVDAGARATLVDAVRLAASEAMTNAVRYAYRGKAGAIHVRAAVVSGELWILVSDDGCGLQPHAYRPGLGLGLGLISQLSDDFAIGSRASGGIEVRIRFNLGAPRSAPAERETDRRSVSYLRRPGSTPSISPV
jgi:anti-sigma regulatory factor (Ser/Thr protein kinase)